MAQGVNEKNEQEKEQEEKQVEQEAQVEQEQEAQAEDEQEKAKREWQETERKAREKVEQELKEAERKAQEAEQEWKQVERELNESGRDWKEFSKEWRVIDRKLIKVLDERKLIKEKGAQNLLKDRMDALNKEEPELRASSEEWNKKTTEAMKRFQRKLLERDEKEKAAWEAREQAERMAEKKGELELRLLEQELQRADQEAEKTALEYRQAQQKSMDFVTQRELIEIEREDLNLRPFSPENQEKRRKLGERLEALEKEETEYEKIYDEARTRNDKARIKVSIAEGNIWNKQEELAEAEEVRQEKAEQFDQELYEKAEKELNEAEKGLQELNLQQERNDKKFSEINAENHQISFEEMTQTMAELEHPDEWKTPEKRRESAEKKKAWKERSAVLAKEEQEAIELGGDLISDIMGAESNLKRKREIRDRRKSDLEARKAEGEFKQNERREKANAQSEARRARDEKRIAKLIEEDKIREEMKKASERTLQETREKLKEAREKEARETRERARQEREREEAIRKQRQAEREKAAKEEAERKAQEAREKAAKEEQERKAQEEREAREEKEPEPVKPNKKKPEAFGMDILDALLAKQREERREQLKRWAGAGLKEAQEDLEEFEREEQKRKAEQPPEEVADPDQVEQEKNPDQVKREKNPNVDGLFNMFANDVPSEDRMEDWTRVQWTDKMDQVFVLKTLENNAKNKKTSANDIEDKDRVALLNVISFRREQIIQDSPMYKAVRDLASAKKLRKAIKEPDKFMRSLTGVTKRHMEVLKNDIGGLSTAILKDSLERMRNAKRGGLFRDSRSFENMKAAVQEATNREGTPEELAALDYKAVKMAKKYVKAHKSPRRTKAGRERFNQAMRVLGAKLPPDAFKDYVKKLNRERGTENPGKNHLDAEKFICTSPEREIGLALKNAQNGEEVTKEQAARIAAAYQVNKEKNPNKNLSNQAVSEAELNRKYSAVMDDPIFHGWYEQKGRENIIKALRENPKEISDYETDLKKMTGFDKSQEKERTSSQTALQL